MQYVIQELPPLTIAIKRQTKSWPNYVYTVRSKGSNDCPSNTPNPIPIQKRIETPQFLTKNKICIPFYEKVGASSSFTLLPAFSPSQFRPSPVPSSQP